MPRFFSREFITKCKRLVPESNLQSSLLKDHDFNVLLSHLFNIMTSLYCDKSNAQIYIYKSSHSESKINIESSRSRILSDESKTEFEESELEKFIKYLQEQETWVKNHSPDRIHTFKKLKKEIIAYIADNWSHVDMNLRRMGEANQHVIKENRMIMCCDICGVGVCCICVVIQCPISFFKMFENKKIESGKLYCDGYSTTKSLYLEAVERSKESSKLKSRGSSIYFAEVKELKSFPVAPPSLKMK